MSFESGLVHPVRAPAWHAQAKECVRMRIEPKLRHSFVLQKLGFAALLGGIIAVSANAQENRSVLPTIDVTSSRLIPDIVGASTTVITAEQIARSPGESLQAIMSRVPGVQTWSTFGAVNGAGTVVDMRGFGASAASNTLVLINGRRLTDVDLGGVDFSAIPRESIERIEITRGNSGAVLYGDGAVGGTINIVTKSGVNLPPSV
ncbi:MAG TPA: TonB-dependent receptor plug domain-containing protein [Steroidobacteraceae bacterium]|nr:TonB-dependent receptor plug domain-containing protein [Steroidobacteraceae bacterium]